MELGQYQPDNIYCGDSAVLLAAMPDACIDLTVTSPPYDNLRMYNGFTLDWHEIIRQLYRVTKPGGVVVWVVADATINGSETGTSFKQALWAMECGFNNETMIYEQAGTGAKGSNYYYWQSFEFMFVWAKGQPKTSNRIADRKNLQVGNVTGQSNLYKTRKTRAERGRRVVPAYSVRTNIWRYQVGNNGDETCGVDHPAIFPEALARDHILSWSNPGDLVLDPHVGSGTTPKMCIETSRHFLCFDISQEYVDLSKRRVAGARRPLLVVA